jgi:hypothetical protein
MKLGTKANGVIVVTAVALAAIGCVRAEATSAEAHVAAAPAVGPPEKLSETGLYADIVGGKVADGVESYEPLTPHFADGADMRRYIRLPPSQKIDTTDMDNWVLPVGTKMWKEFRVGGKRVETRTSTRISEADWSVVSYSWREDQSEADLSPLGGKNVLGTRHEIPSVGACFSCHGREKVIGFSAIQLSHDKPGLTIRKLSDRGFLTVPAPEGFAIPGCHDEAEALGYLHANCGHCHNDRHATGLRFRISTKARCVQDTGAYQTAIGVGTVRDHGPKTRVAPGDPGGSAVHFRMTSLGRGDFLWKLGVRKQDDRGIAVVDAWIRGLERDSGAAREAGAAGAHPSSSSISQR